MNVQLTKRIKSLIWRSGMMGVAVFVSTLTDNIGALELTPLATTILGLLLGEVTKFLNRK